MKYRITSEAIPGLNGVEFEVRAGASEEEVADAARVHIAFEWDEVER